MSKFGKELIESANEALAIAKGEMKPARVIEPEAIDVAAIRKKTGMSQARFAMTFKIPESTLKDWEQGRRNPDATARAYLTVITNDNAAVQESLQQV